MEINKDADTMHVYMHSISQYPVLTAEEEALLGEKILNNDKEAQDWLIKCNLKLVVYIAKRYTNVSDMSLMDLIQEGNLGLIEAAKKFDYRLGYKFSTYAAFWIKRMITKALTNDSRMIRLPANIVNQLMKIDKAKKEYLLHNDKEPTSLELSKILNIPEEEINDILELSKTPVSLDKPLNDDEDGYVYDIINDVSKANLNSNLLRKDAVLTVIDSLDAREAKILKLRFGLENGNNKTLEEVGKTIGLTRERVRQLENQALRKLRSPARINLLKELL